MLKGAPASAKQMDDRELSRRHRFGDRRLALLYRMGRTAGYLMGQQENSRMQTTTLGRSICFAVRVLELPKPLARWRPIFASDVEPLCVAVGTLGLIVSTGRSIGVRVMMISLGIIAVLVFIAVSAVHASRAP